MEEVLTSEDMEIHYSYKKEGYPDDKVLDGPFSQYVKGERKCEGAYKEGKKQGIWSYYINNPHHPMARDYFDNGNRIKYEVLHNDGHHIRMVCTFDDKDHPIKQIAYDDDGKTIIKLDIFQNGLLKEENLVTPEGKKQVVYQYNQEHRLVEKRHFLNDDLTKIESIS